MLRRVLIRIIGAKFTGGETLASMPTDILLSYIIERGVMLCRGLLRLRKVCFIGKGVRFKCKRRIRLGKFVTIHDFSYIDGSSLKGIIIGDYCTIGRNNYVRSGNLASHDGYFIMETRSSSNNDCFFGATGGIHIGSNVMIGPNVTIITERHVVAQTDKAMRDQGIEKLPVTIEDDTWLGANAVILGGTMIGGGAVVGAASIVTKSVGRGEVVAGNPARVLRTRNGNP